MGGLLSREGDQTGRGRRHRRCIATMAEETAQRFDGGAIMVFIGACRQGLTLAVHQKYGLFGFAHAAPIMRSILICNSVCALGQCGSEVNIAYSDKVARTDHKLVARRSAGAIVAPNVAPWGSGPRSICFKFAADRVCRR